jgi:hypothetical protein
MGSMYVWWLDAMYAWWLDDGYLSSISMAGWWLVSWCVARCMQTLQQSLDEQQSIVNDLKEGLQAFMPLVQGLIAK